MADLADSCCLEDHQVQRKEHRWATGLFSWFKTTRLGSYRYLIVNASIEHGASDDEVQQCIDRHRRTLPQGLLRHERSATPTGRPGRFLAAPAVAVNWTARATGDEPHRNLATSARTIDTSRRPT